MDTDVPTGVFQGLAQCRGGLQIRDRSILRRSGTLLHTYTHTARSTRAHAGHALSMHTTPAAPPTDTLDLWPMLWPRRWPLHHTRSRRHKHPHLRPSPSSPPRATGPQRPRSQSQRAECCPAAAASGIKECAPRRVGAAPPPTPPPPARWHSKGARRRALRRGRRRRPRRPRPRRSPSR